MISSHVGTDARRPRPPAAFRVGRVRAVRSWPGSASAVAGSAGGWVAGPPAAAAGRDTPGRLAPAAGAAGGCAGGRLGCAGPRGAGGCPPGARGCAWGWSDVDDCPPASGTGRRAPEASGVPAGYAREASCAVGRSAREPSDAVGSGAAGLDRGTNGVTVPRPRTRTDGCTGSPALSSASSGSDRRAALSSSGAA